MCTGLVLLPSLLAHSEHVEGCLVDLATVDDHQHVPNGQYADLLVALRAGSLNCFPNFGDNCNLQRWFASMWGPDGFTEQVAVERDGYIALLSSTSDFPEQAVDDCILQL